MVGFCHVGNLLGNHRHHHHHHHQVDVELEKQLEELQIVVGLRCLSVLRYLTDHTGVLSLGVLAR